MSQNQHSARPKTGHSNHKVTLSSMRLAVSAVTLCWLLSGNTPSAAVGAVCLILSYGPDVLVEDERLRTRATLCITAMLCAHVVLGMRAGLYETSLLYDKAAHALGCAAIAGIVWPTLSQSCEKRQIPFPPGALALATLGIVVSRGTAWEIFEFSIDQTGLFRTQRGLTDTMIDLIANTMGAGAVALAQFWLAKRRSAPQLFLTHTPRQA